MRPQGWIGLRYGLFFVTLKKKDLEPIIGIWPGILKRLHRPKPKSVKTVKPDKTFHAAFMIEDMTTILVECSAEPFRLKSTDHLLFAKAKKTIESNVLQVPEWMQDMFYFKTEHRISYAMQFLTGLKLIRTAGKEGVSLRFEPTKKGMDWLGLVEKAKLEYIFEQIRKPSGSAVYHSEYSHYRYINGIPNWMPFQLNKGTQPDIDNVIKNVALPK